MLTNENFVSYAREHYRSPKFFTEEEFEADLARIVTLKKLFRRYTTTGNINERLVLNNIIILNNMFGVAATNVMLFFRVEPEHYPVLKAFLLFLNIYVQTDVTRTIPLDKTVVGLLRDIRR